MLLDMENEKKTVVGDQIMLQKTQAHPLHPHPVRLVFFAVDCFCLCVRVVLSQERQEHRNEHNIMKLVFDIHFTNITRVL